MDKENLPINDKIRLYSSQTQAVKDIIEKDGISIVKREYVENKYQESGKSFLTVYDWFSKMAQKIVEKPKDAQSPYWAFENLCCVDVNDNKDGILVLDVPKDQVILFDMYDWIKIMKFEYLGENPKENEEFHKLLVDYGINEYKVMMSDFYLQQKNEIFKSWERLFIHHEQLLKGDRSKVKMVQAAIWKIEKDWIVK